MNKEWSDLNKTMQAQLKKESTFHEGMKTLFLLRKKLIKELVQLKVELKREDFDAIPYMNANGYHNKTIAYSIWHIARIEDIVVNSLIMHDTQIFFSDDYQSRIVSPMITTGNELRKQQIADFSKTLNIDELYSYVAAVTKRTDEVLHEVSYQDIKRKMTKEDKAYVTSLHVVSEDEHANWLLDYWCGKDIKGLIQMPLSRHWIMHIEACLRIKDKIHTI